MHILYSQGHMHTLDYKRIPLFWACLRFKFSVTLWENRFGYKRTPKIAQTSIYKRYMHMTARIRYMCQCCIIIGLGCTEEAFSEMGDTMRSEGPLYSPAIGTGMVSVHANFTKLSAGNMSHKEIQVE